MGRSGFFRVEGAALSNFRFRVLGFKFRNGLWTLSFLATLYTPSPSLKP